jgi:methionine-gamma-lyase
MFFLIRIPHYISKLLDIGGDQMSERDIKKKHFSTICIHGSGGVDPVTGALSTPIYQSSTFAFRSVKEGAEIFAGEREGYFYTRLGNPTHAALEKEMAYLESGEKALALGSGMAAISTVILSLTRSGENLVASNAVYGGTHDLFTEMLSRLDIEVREVDALEPENVAKAIDDNTRMVLIETPANPTLTIIDIEECARICRSRDIPLVVDNTFATPYYQRPIELGADIVVHSATKYIGGHGDTVGGIIIGPADFITEARNCAVKDLGGIISPFNAWLLLRGLKTLPVRMERHSENAMEVAQYLEGHPKVRRVWYPGLRTHPQHQLVRKQQSGFGGMIAFEVRGGKEAGEILLNSVRLIILSVSLGDVDTLIEHPASMTHSTYSEEELKAIGVTGGFIRLSVGLEDVNDLINDLSQAFQKTPA